MGYLPYHLPWEVHPTARHSPHARAGGGLGIVSVTVRCYCYSKMKHITYRELQTNTAWMSELPVALTRYGKVVAIINKPEENVTVTNTADNKKCQRPDRFGQPCNLPTIEGKNVCYRHSLQG